MFYIYILFSKSIDRYYIGHTSDVYRRLYEHNNPVESSKYTGKGVPWNLILYFEISDSRSEAIQVERFIKRQKNRSFIQKLVMQNGNYRSEKEYSKIRSGESNPEDSGLMTSSSKLKEKKFQCLPRSESYSAAGACPVANLFCYWGWIT